MMTRFVLEAELELNEAAQFYELRRKGLGLTFIEAISASLREIAAAPGRFPKVHTSLGSREIHRIRLSRFPYSIAYEILGDELVVLAIAHGRRHPRYWIKRRP